MSNEARWVNFPSIGGEIRGYLALPEGADGPVPSVVMAHENLGVTDHRLEVTRRLADEGFAALTVDLFSRAGGPPTEWETHEERRIKAFLSATDDQAVPDLLAGVRYLDTLDEADAERAGVIGFCMGGGTAIAATLLGDAFAAAVALYALPILPPEYSFSGRSVSRVAQAPAIRCPLQLHFGEDDDVIPMEQVRMLEEAALKSGMEVESFTYAGAGHAYHDDTHPNHAAEAAALTWERAMGFLRERL
jgi:carboxymethylenebutenolidase